VFGELIFPETFNQVRDNSDAGRYNTAIRGLGIIGAHHALIAQALRGFSENCVLAVCQN
jgi:hypothetical protein